MLELVIYYLFSIFSAEIFIIVDFILMLKFAAVEFCHLLSRVMKFGKSSLTR